LKILQWTIQQPPNRLDTQKLPYKKETEVVQAKFPHRPGELARAASQLGEANININHAYSLQKAAERRSPNALASLGHIYGLIGREKEAKEILSELSTRAGQENI